MASAHLLPRSWYARDAADVAQALLGQVLVRRLDGAWRRARIVETEAYVGAHDLASHSSKGRTPRNAAMWGAAGHAYVYRIYGLHWMLNVVTGQRDGQAVLLRAAEPLDGWDANLRGPALLAAAFGVTKADDHADLVRPTAGGLRIAAGTPPRRTATSPRIGVPYAGTWAAEHLRFVDADSAHLSRPQR